MGIIKLQNIRCYAYHGCLVEEGKIGSDYLVNLTVLADLKKSSETDDLTDTADYVDLNRIVVEEMAIRSKLLEHVGRRIIDRVFKELIVIQKVIVEVSKVNPPIGGDVESVTIEMEEVRLISN
jgi:dihydroneopterin aldolase